MVPIASSPLITLVAASTVAQIQMTSDIQKREDVRTSFIGAYP